MFGFASRVEKVERHRLFWAQAYPQRALRAVRPWIDSGVVFKLDPNLFFGEPLHLIHFVVIDIGRNGLQRQGQIPFFQQADSPHAPIERTGDLRERLIGFACCAVQRNFNTERPVFHQVVGDSRRDQSPIREQRDDEPTLFRLRVNIQEVFARKNLSAGIENPKAIHRNQFVQKPHVFFQRQFLLARVVVAHRQVVVTMLTLERAAVRYLNRHLRRNPPPLLALVDQAGEITVCCNL